MSGNQGCCLREFLRSLGYKLLWSILGEGGGGLDGVAQEI